MCYVDGMPVTESHSCYKIILGHLSSAGSATALCVVYV